MSAEQTGAFFALVSVCSGLGSVLSLLLLLAKLVRERPIIKQQVLVLR